MMPDYTGEILLDQIFATPLPGISPNVAYSLDDIRSLALLDSLHGYSDSPSPIDYDALISPEPGIAYDGNILGCFEELFEKIIVTPRRYDCGFVLADVHWNTNVWNTHWNKISVLTGVDIQDSGNVSVDNPLGYPVTFGPFQARDFLTIVPRDGDATVQAILTFLMSGETGTDVVITGNRIIVFAFEPDWTEPVKEKTQYLTSILSAYSSKEQRIALRKHPRTHLGYRVLPTDYKTSQALEALIYGHQGRTIGVPFWPDATRITQSTDVFTSVIYADTIKRKFFPGGLVVLWRDFFTNEAATILSVAAGSITTTAPLNNPWPADGHTYAIPVLAGRWDGSAGLTHIAPSLSELDAQFQCDLAPDVSPSSPAQVYGYDVLEAHPNSIEDRITEYSRNLRILDSTTGRTKFYDRAGVALSRLDSFLWTLLNRNEIAAARAWFALRKGQQKAFWVPTWKHDLIQATDLVAGNANLVIENTGYTRYQYPQPARRYLRFAMLDGSGTWYYRKVTGSSEGGGTETLVLSSALSAVNPVPAGSCMISFLRLVRLASDELELAWHSRDVAEIPLEFIELPLEVSP